VANALASSYLFLLDAALSFGGMCFIKTYWEDAIKFSNHYYPNEFLFIVVPSYILIWITAIFFSGGYDKPFRISQIVRGIFFGTIAIAVLYAFIPNEWRFSRAIIILGALWTGFEMLLVRSLYHLIKYQTIGPENEAEMRSLIVGKEEAVRAERILRELGNAEEITSIGDISFAKKSAAIFGINQIVFCAAEFSYDAIIQQILECGDKIEYKILNEGSTALMGSNSTNQSGDFYVAERSYALFRPENLRSKKVFDCIISLLFIPLMPVNVFLVTNFGTFVSNWITVLTGRKSWVGFSSQVNLARFPNAMEGILHPSAGLNEIELNEEDVINTELNYAKKYTVSQDVKLLIRNYSALGK
jgi:hypothetical protein